MPELEIDETKVEELIGKFMEDMAPAVHAATVHIGDRLGLYKALAEGGPQTAEELAESTGYRSRLVREWLNAQVASEYCLYDPASLRYSMTPEQAAVLAWEGPTFQLPLAGLVNSIHKDEEKVRRAFTGDQEFSWIDHDHSLFVNMSRSSASDFAALVPEWIPALDGVEEKLRAGAKVADIGCGFGGPTILMAQAFPESTFAGFDFHAESVDAARKAAAEGGVSDRVTFEVALADSFPGQDYDFITSFDAIHDMGDPVGAARRIRGALKPNGTWLLTELNAEDEVIENINPLGRLLYSASTFICVPNALSQGGKRVLGGAAGTAALREVALEAGFSSCEPAIDAPFNLVLEVRQ